MTTAASTIKCPECKQQINVEGGEVGDYFECDTCFAELILTSIDPPAVDLVDEEK